MDLPPPGAMPPRGPMADRMPPPGAMPPRGPMSFPAPQAPRDLRVAAVLQGGGGVPPPLPPPGRKGGSGPLSWEEYFTKSDDVTVGSGDCFRVYSAGPAGAPVILCLHGGGYTGLTWGLVAQRLSDKYRVVAPDLRGHGGSKTSSDGDLSADVLAADVVALWEATYANEGDKPPPVLLVGHSMGGAIAVRAACLKKMPSIQGVVVIDVVEGTALASLAFMHGILSSRPKVFPSQQKAIEWACKSGMSKNEEAARLSVPSMLVEGEGGKWTWRTDLEKSDVYWRGWYEGLSQLFIGAPGYKLLMLAGSDRLDKDLTIGQMQGKFQMTLLPAAGHAIHEDEPDKTAEAIRGFATSTQTWNGCTPRKDTLLDK